MIARAKALKDRVIRYGSHLSMLTFAVVMHAWPQWVGVSHPPAHGILSVEPFSIPSIQLRYQFAGTDNGGVYVTPDHGGFWVEENTGLANRRINAVEFWGATAFAAPFGGGIHRSTDHGASWKESTHGMPGLLDGWSDKNVWDLHACGSALFAATDRGLYRSLDSGLTWALNLPYDFVESRMVSDGSTVLVSNHTTVLASSDAGEHWTPLTSIGYIVSDLLILNGSIVVSTGLGAGVYRSSDSGATWIEAGSGLEGHTNVRALVSVDGTLLAGCSSYSGSSAGGIFRSTDQGQHWTSSGLPFTDVRDLFAIGTSIFAAASDGVYRSTDEGNTWDWLDTGAGADYFWCVSGDQNVLLAGSDRHGLAMSHDVGASWGLSNSGLVTERVNALLLQGSRLFAGTSNGVFVSDLSMAILWSPAIWQRAQSGMGPFSVTAFAMSSDSALVLAGTDSTGIYGTTDGGTTWALHSENLEDVHVRTLIRHDSLFVAGTRDSGVFVSDPSGATWMRRSSGLPSGPITALASAGSAILAGTASHGTYFSDDDGSSWSSISDGSGSASIHALVSIDSAVIAATDRGVILFRPMGGTWSARAIGPYAFEPTRVWISYGNLFASTPSVVYRADLEIVTSAVDVTHESPSSFSVDRAYPNPFNARTELSFSLPESGTVEAVVFDLLGRPVATLFHGPLSAGLHRTSWSADRAGSGVYVLRIRFGNHVAVQRLVLIK